MLSYADRLKRMRETKIRHTLEKRTQNGYTDLDDFGTVPITPDYEVEWLTKNEASRKIDKLLARYGIRSDAVRKQNAE